MIEVLEQDTVKTRAIEKLRRDLGHDVVSALSDPDTIEIMVNPDGKIWQERLGEPMCCIGTMLSARAESIIKTLAGIHNKTVSYDNPVLECELPLDDSRFAGQIPPVVKAPSFAIRKRAIAIFTLDAYVNTGIMSKTHCIAIKDAIKNHRNILIIGGTGSGKTTLVNAIIHEMSVLNPKERLVIIEDTGEIQCKGENFIFYHTTLNTTLTTLIKTSLRMRPDRILVGEVRGPEALDLLDVWNTGHEGGAATLHANNAAAGLVRLRSLISRNEFAPKVIEPLIAEAVHMVVHIAKTPEGRRVKEVLEVSGYTNNQYITKNL